jgi:hypothetical protein
MAQVFAKGPRSHHQHSTFLANLRSVWRFTAVTCALAMVSFLYALGQVGTLDQLAIMFFSDDPLPMMTMELLLL